MQNCRNTSKNVFLKAHLTSLSGQVFSCSTSSVIFISILQSLRYISKLEWWYNEKYLCFQIRKNPKIKPILHNTKSLFKIATEFITSNYWNRSVSGRIVETLLILFSWKDIWPVSLDRSFRVHRFHVISFSHCSQGIDSCICGLLLSKFALLMCFGWKGNSFYKWGIFVLSACSFHKL